jgi:hypothetical protein
MPHVDQTVKQLARACIRTPSFLIARTSIGFGRGA